MRLLITLFLTIFICACGQKGPLFLPTDTGEEKVTGSNAPAQMQSQNESIATESAANSEAPDKAKFEAQLKSTQSNSNP